MGMLLSIFLAQFSTSSIKWNMRMTGKKFDGYHQVRIVWPEKVLKFDPIFHSLAWSEAIARGEGSYRIWCEYYLRWQDILEGREPRSLQGV